MTILQKAKILKAWTVLERLHEELEVMNTDPQARQKIETIMNELENLL